MHEDSILKRAGLTTPEARNDMGSFMGLLMQEELRKNPDLMTVDFSSVEKAAAAQRELNRKNQADKPKAPATKELDGLRRQKFNLTEHVKNTASYTATMEDQARGTKERIAALLKRKKAARAANQIHDERSCENQVRVLEGEVVDFEKNAEHGRKNHKAAKAALAAFEQTNGARLAALEKELT
jgi:hypothetical protein